MRSENEVFLIVYFIRNIAAINYQVTVYNTDLIMFDTPTVCVFVPAITGTKFIFETDIGHDSSE